MSDKIINRLKELSKLNDFTIANIIIFEPGAVYLYDDKKLICKFKSVDDFLSVQHNSKGEDDES